MRILITGGAGYVGSATLRHLVKNGHDVLAYDNLSQGHVKATGKSKVICGDISDTALLTKTLFEFKADAVMHFAAATNVGESVVKPDFHYENNVAGTLSILQAMKDSGVRQMLFSSTCATYGLTELELIDETTPLCPFSPYARSKLAVEWLIRDFANAYDIGFTLLRYFNAAGADATGKYGEFHRPETHLIPLVLEVALGKRDSISIFGTDYSTPDGTCIRDYVHIDDLASAHRFAIEASKPETAEVYNVGTGKGYSVLEVIRACEKITGMKIPNSIEDRRLGDPPRLVADPSKIEDCLRWAPQYTSIEDLIATAWEWHRRNPDGYS